MGCPFFVMLGEIYFSVGYVVGVVLDVCRFERIYHYFSFSLL
jgi:hypothetical protein